MLAYLLAFVLLAPPTYASCFDAYLRALQQINIDEAYGMTTHEQAVLRRIYAASDYAACKREAFRAWLRERIRTNPERLYD